MNLFPPALRPCASPSPEGGWQAGLPHTGATGCIVRCSPQAVAGLRRFHALSFNNNKVKRNNSTP